MKKKVEPYVLRVTVGITGGRDRLPTKDQRRAIAGMGFEPKNTHLVHGGAKGIDVSIAKRARAKGWITTCVAADWKGYGGGAGHIRNSLIVRASDFLVTCGGNSGTGNCVEQAVAFGRSIIDLSGLIAREGEDVSVPLPNGKFRHQWKESKKK